MVKTRSLGDDDLSDGDGECGCPGGSKYPHMTGMTMKISRCNKLHSRKPTSGGLFQSKDGLFSGLAELITNKLDISVQAFIQIWITFVLAALAGYFHWSHLTTLFENDRHFSHLSTLEKEMAFRTEMGLYFSYFKNFIHAPSFTHGLHLIMNDRFVEHPLVINALKRLNLYPEVFLASLFRMYTGTMDFLGIPTKACWIVDRGEGLNPVESCEGMGDSAQFYVTSVFLLNGLMMSLFFIYGSYLSGSRVGGLVTVLCLFFNHEECTRVMWTPSLRESFSYPFFVVQMLLLTYIVRSLNPGKWVLIAHGVCNVLFMLPSPFAQFVLLTQIGSLYACWILDYLNLSKMKDLLIVHLASVAISFVLLFCNMMLLTSFYTSSLLAGWIVITLRHNITRHFKPGVKTILAQGIAFIALTVVLKFTMSAVLRASDDVHIGNLIRSKLTNYKDFHSLMYTCAPEYDFMELETLLGYIKTLILPTNMVVAMVIAGKTIKEVWKGLRRAKEEPRQNTDDSHQTAQFGSGEMVFHVLQLLAFTVMGVLVMRMKLFLAPHMCLMASLVCSRPLFGWIGERQRHNFMVFGILSIMAIQGVANIQSQRSLVGDFSNPPQVQLLEWIKANTEHNAIFAGATPTMASVKLSTGRPIVIHPHYEDAGQRETTKLVYTMYSRKPVQEAKRILTYLQVDYFILEDAWCTQRTRPGCSLPEIWDVEDHQNRGKMPLCSQLAADSQPHFSTVFDNKVYKVLKVPKMAKHDV